MASSVKSAARSAESSPAFRGLARAGYAANGVVHVLIGVLVLVVSFGGSGDTDQSGAFRAVAETPFGVFGLWAIAVALWALGVWHAVSAFLARGSSGTKRAGRIVSEAGQAVAFIAVGSVAASVALGSRSQGEQITEQASSGVLSLPGGPILLVAAGLVIGGIGVGFVVIGIKRSFRKKLIIPAGTAGTAITVLGVVGYIAKGVALAIVVVLVLTAAVTLDPQAAGGLDGAVQALLALPFGVFLGAAVGVGFVAYGVFTVLRARYARLDA